MKALAWTAWFLFILSLLFLSGARAQEAPPNLTGDWVLNERESDDLAKLMPQPTTGRQGGGGGMGKGGGRGVSRGGHGGGRGGISGGNEDPEARAQDRLTHARQEFSRLQIYHDGIELNVTDGLDISRLLFTDGRERKIWTQQGEATATAVWQERTLVVSWKTSQDARRRVRHYLLSDDGRKLSVTENRRLPGQDEHVGIKLVYDLQE